MRALPNMGATGEQLRKPHLNGHLDSETSVEALREYLLPPTIYGRSRPEHSVSRNAQAKLRFN